MIKLHYLAIPLVIGVLAGAFLVFYHEPENDPNKLTESKLIDGGSPIRGDPYAPITILEWGDYQCTYCHRFHETTLPTIEEDFIKTGKVKMVFKDFPLNGPDSVLAAEAAYCANDQERYWEFHDEVYKNWAGERTGWITKNSLNSFAAKVGLDLDRFNNCINSHVYQNNVNQSYKHGQELGIDATPYFLIFNDQKNHQS